MTDHYYVLNPVDGTDILHRDPREVCNTDQATDRQTIDAATATALLTSDVVRRCGHCWGDD